MVYKKHTIQSKLGDKLNTMKLSVFIVMVQWNCMPKLPDDTNRSTSKKKKKFKINAFKSLGISYMNYNKYNND